MKKIERHIIFETLTGSHLFGTYRLDSDHDYMGIFLPSSDDMLGLENCPTEWSKDEKYSTGNRNTVGDVDRKYYSLKQFFNLLAEGQSNQLEMLYSPKEMWTIPKRPYKEGWSRIIKNRSMFVSKNSVLPFIGFAKAQAVKATLKGEHLNNIRKLIDQLSQFHPYTSLGEVIDYLQSDSYLRENNTYYELITTEGGMSGIELAGRQYENTQQIRYVLQKLKKLEEKYGTRSEAAAQLGFDYKSLMHAYRLVYEAKMLLTEGELRFPFPDPIVQQLMLIRSGDYLWESGVSDYFQELEDKLTELRELKEKSTLPETINRSAINQLCQEMMYEHLFGDTH